MREILRFMLTLSLSLSLSPVSLLLLKIKKKKRKECISLFFSSSNNLNTNHKQNQQADAGGDQSLFHVKGLHFRPEHSAGRYITRRRIAGYGLKKHELPDRDARV